MTEATIYAVVVVTCATLAYFWPTIRRKYAWWSLKRQTGKVRVSVEAATEAFEDAAVRADALVAALNYRLAQAAFDAPDHYPRLVRSTRREDGLYTAWVEPTPNTPLVMAHGETMRDAVGLAMGDAMGVLDD